jgi:hypothetical protein
MPLFSLIGSVGLAEPTYSRHEIKKSSLKLTDIFAS